MKKYTNPMLEIINIQTLDVITVSANDPEENYPIDDIASYSGFLR